MRLTLVISSLAGGGAERLVSLLASAWALQGKKVTLLTFDHNEPPEYPLHAAVEHQSLCLQATSHNLFHGAWQNFRRIRVLRRAIRESEPDIVIGFLDATNILTLCATLGLGRPVVVCEFNNPIGHRIKRIWAFLRRVSYRFADALVCETHPTLTRFLAMIKIKGWVIPPFISVPPANRNGGNGHSSARVIAAMGRLDRQKGFDLLLDAFARIVDRHPDWSLKIIGQGPLRKELEQQTAALKLAERVHFAGRVVDPFAVLGSSDLFVFSSRSEGFGLALGEAMACGLPVVSFDCESGPRHIIRHGLDGILVPPEDVGALAGELDRLMGDPQERARLAARAPEVLRRFSADQTLELWQKLFDTLA